MTSSKTPERALVTGCAGFAARHLIEALRAGGTAVTGVDRVKPSPAVSESLDDTALGDVTDYAFLERTVADARPDAVFHLAAMTFGQPEGPTDRRFFEVNVDGTRNLIEALLARDLRPRFLVTGSSAAYGAPDARTPLTEAAPSRPQTLYAASKVCQELIALTYQRTHRLPVVVTRAFNHTGPGEHPHFAASAFAQQIAAIEAGAQAPPIRVGNLESFRDFSDVRDVVRGYIAAATEGRTGECYNVCSGQARRVSEVLDGLLAHASIDIPIEVDPDRLQPSDVPYQCGSSDKLRRQTGWKPKIPFERTLADLLDHWRRDAGAIAGTPREQIPAAEPPRVE